MKWTITDPESGQSMDYEGDAAPTKEEIDMLFGKNLPQYTRPIGPVEPPISRYGQPIGPVAPPVSLQTESPIAYAGRSPIVQQFGRGLAGAARDIAGRVRTGFDVVTGPGRLALSLGSRFMRAAAPIAKQAFMQQPGVELATQLVPGNLGTMAALGEGAIRSNVIPPAANWFRKNVVPPPLAGRINAISPDGRRGTIPAEQAVRARQLGYTLLE